MLDKANGEFSVNVASLQGICQKAVRFWLELESQTFKCITTMLEMAAVHNLSALKAEEPILAQRIARTFMIYHLSRSLKLYYFVDSAFLYLAKLSVVLSSV